MLEHIAHKRPDSIHRKDVDMLAEMIMRGEFMAGNRITLAVNDDRDLVSVDGSNILRASVDTKWSAGRSVATAWTGNRIAERRRPRRGVHPFIIPEARGASIC